MIEYLYSRIIVSRASVALVAVVASAAIGASEQASMRCADQIASSISRAVAAASAVEADSFEQRIVFDRGSSTQDLRVSINVTCVEVQKGRYSAVRPFERPISLLSEGVHVDSVEVMPGSVIKVKACRALLEKENEVTIEVSADLHLSYLAHSGDEPVDISSVVVDVERSACRAVRHPPVLEPGVRAVHA